MHTEGPHNGHSGTHHHVHILALDTPETDSHVKQIVTQLANWINKRPMFVSKEGDGGLQVWQLGGNSFGRWPAHPNIIATSLDMADPEAGSEPSL